MPSLMAQLQVETIPSNEHDEEVLNGDPAPFNGVLVPVDTYRKYQATIDKYKYRVQHDDQNMPLCPDTEPLLTIFDSSTLLKVGIGLILGLVIGISVSH